MSHSRHFAHQKICTLFKNMHPVLIKPLLAGKTLKSLPSDTAYLSVLFQGFQVHVEWLYHNWGNLIGNWVKHEPNMISGIWKFKQSSSLSPGMANAALTVFFWAPSRCSFKRSIDDQTTSGLVKTIFVKWIVFLQKFFVLKVSSLLALYR